MYAGKCTNLTDRFGGMKAPTSVDVCLADVIASVTAAVRVRGQTTVTRTAVVRGALFVEPVELIARVRRLRVGNLVSVLVETHFQDLVGDIALDFPTNVHDVQTEDCGRYVNFS